MEKIAACFLLCLVAVSFALPSPVDLSKVDALGENSGEGYSGPELTVDERAEVGRYDPARANAYHLFTRDNPTVSQPLMINNPVLIEMTNFKTSRRTIVLVHGTAESVTADSNTVLIPAFLEAEDLNILVVDWSQGAGSVSVRELVDNTIASGKAVADFINWLNSELDYGADQYHIVGHGYGGHQAGIIGRNVHGDVAYVTGLDPGNIGWLNHAERFKPDDGVYTEVIHTNYALYGYLADLAHVDFYPNGGNDMRGCISNECDHARSYFYFAESIVSGGFTGRRCLNYIAAMSNNCNNSRVRLQMGGLRPKIGSRGVFYLNTNRNSPFSRG